MARAKKSPPAKIKPLKFSRRFATLRAINFILAFALVGVWYLVVTQGARTPGFYGSVEQDQQNRINGRRTSLGLGSLQHIECLNTVAENWAKRMADAGAISHNPNRGAEISQTCKGFWVDIGENVGTTNADSAYLFNAFVASPTHRAQIDTSRYTKSGIGAYWRADGNLYVTQLFAKCHDCSGGWSTNATLPQDPVAPAPITHTALPSDRITAGQTLAKGTIVYSASRNHYLAMQASDGHLVLYNSANRALWSSKTSGTGSHAIMQTDGNFVVYKTGRGACHSNTVGKGGTYAVVQDDGNFVIYTSAGRAVWSSRYDGTTRWHCF